jgi:hypothetical protein
MSGKSARANLATWLISWAASAAFHVAGAWLAIFAWPFILIAFWFSGIPSDDTFSFRWDNPYHRGSSIEEDSELTLVVSPPRRRRELPEMEKPRTEVEWDSRSLPFDEALGSPSPFETPYPGPPDSGLHKAKGDSLDFVSDKPFRGKGTYDSLGWGAGGGGRYGSKVVLKDAVQLGLLWLARHQGEDGSWSAASLGDRCGRALPNGREISGPSCGSEEAGGEVDRWTALAAMAFAGAGYLPDCPHVWDGIRYREVVGRACRFLSRSPRDAQARALALLALSSFIRPPSPFDLPGGDADVLPERTRVRELIAAVEADPSPKEGSDEAAWVSLALVSAARVRLEVTPAILERAEGELRRRCETLPAFQPEAWPGEALAGTYLRLLASYELSPSEKAALPAEKALHPRLRAGQCRDADACREGSWEPLGKESRLSTTLLHLLALESLPGYGFRGGHPLRPEPEPEDPQVLAVVESLRAREQKRIDSVRAVPGALRRGIERVREARLNRDDSSVEEMIRKAFEPAELTYVRFVPTVQIGDHLESDNDEEFQKFKPLTRLGGNRDLITEEVYKGLCEGDGIVGFDGRLTLVVPDKADDLTSLGRTLIFTLPDGTVQADGRPKWEKYVVLGFPAVR